MTRRSLRTPLALLLCIGAGAAGAARVDPALLEAAPGATLPVIVRLAEPPPARPPLRPVFAARVAATVAALRASADVSQSPLRIALQRRGVPHRAFWVANAIAARVDAATLRWLAARGDVASIERDAHALARLPRPEPRRIKAIGAVEWGVDRIRAPQVWALGYLGQGVVLGGQDTGYDWQHPALLASYRGWDGNAAVHAHHWHDAIVAGAANACGFASPQPCDDNGHGTHTMGTMLGDDGGTNQIGVAPAARWIGCRNMNQGDGTVSTYLDCFQWMLAPTNAAGADPRPELAPHVLNNSWLCPPSEGCTLPGVLDEAIANTHAAGIFVVVSAGNNGPACSSINQPPALHPLAFVVGATTSSDTIASFSSRGPVAVDGSGRLKPDAAAPGASIRSSLPAGTYGVLSGTSMAAPHVAGVAALMMSADPALRGDPERVAQILRDTAIDTPSAQDCGAFPGSAVPNAVFGHGRIDALAAVQAVLASADKVFHHGFEQ